ncbi:MAG: TlpA family protein disulfide reductase [Micavibrio aeruginosavorus]|uniref:TlpA family protein disulfide reductase n=1 Tax=Micavibrio aeruginosavorus TaxID=349221 RepID=A0A7T5R147_9BACT|nr:MAG: TlpA family protein disulfide reductase [Micavibrio aeruginosavorus]
MLAAAWLGTEARHLGLHIPQVAAAPQDSGGGGSDFPHLALSNMDGQPVDILAAFPGKSLLVNYWATWCPPCLAEIPSLMALKETVREQGIEVVLISLDFPENSGRLKKLMARYKLDNVDTLYMTQAAQWPLIGGQGLPITVLVSPEQKIISRISGAIDWSGQAGQDFIKSGITPSK